MNRKSITYTVSHAHSQCARALNQSKPRLLLVAGGVAMKHHSKNLLYRGIRCFSLDKTNSLSRCVLNTQHQYKPSGHPTEVLPSEKKRVKFQPFSQQASSTSGAIGMTPSPAVRYLLSLHKITDQSKIKASGPKNRILKG